MNENAFKTADATVLEFGMLNVGDKVIIGLSGGADSVCLFYYLLFKRYELNLELFAVHINHGLRGKGAEADARFCEGICAAVGVTFELVEVDTAKSAKNAKLGIEEAGRALRYAAFNDAAERFGGNKIAVAHNADDNAETVLLRLLRGTGIAGLGGIPPVNGKIIRPLIAMPRVEIEKYLLDNNIGWVTDETNGDNVFTRNKVRNELIPALREGYNPSISSALNKMAEICRNEDDFIETEARSAFERCVIGKVKLSVELMKCEHIAIQRRVVRLAIAEAGVGKNVSRVHVERVIGLVNGRSGTRVPIIDGLYAEFSMGILIFEKKNETEANEFCYEVCIGKEGKVGTLALRNRREGDKFRTDMNHNKKIKKYITEKKIPVMDRVGLFYLADGNDILWFGDGKGISFTAYF